MSDVEAARGAGSSVTAPAAYTRADAYRTVTSLLQVILGIVILGRTLPFGVHVQALLVALGFIGLGAYRLSFVVVYLKRRWRLG